MGCDYYIVKELEIYFKYSIFPQIRIELERNMGYFDFDIDSDDPNYEELEEKYINNILTPSIKPIIIYMNTFINNEYETKYKNMINNRLKKYNETNEQNKDWDDIPKISMVERRYERT
jgi:hypothetical protein